MNRWLVFVLLILFVLPTRAALLTIEAPCSGIAVQRDVWDQDLPRSVGDLTVATLTRAGIAFIGNELGIHTMLGTPMGEEALEIITPMEMRSYGWCYSVDGEVPEVLPAYFEVNKSHKNIIWFFGFAHYKAGDWVSQCEKVSDSKPAFICAD